MVGAGASSEGTADDPTDDDLAARAARGDQRAFALLVGRHRRLVDAACATRCADRVEREDAVQQALVDIWRGLPGFQGGAKVTTWMYRVAQNAAYRHTRRSQRAARGVVDGADPVDRPAIAAEWNDAVDLRDAVVAILERLPEDHRDALLLHTQGGLSIQEIAEMKFAAVGTVKSWIHRARAELARSLELDDR